MSSMSKSCSRVSPRTAPPPASPPELSLPRLRVQRWRRLRVRWIIPIPPLARPGMVVRGSAASFQRGGVYAGRG
jgi:hypothetical protein